MDFFQVIRDRRSIRKYKDTPVEQDKIEQILEVIP
jgi:nitroreductase